MLLPINGPLLCSYWNLQLYKSNKSLKYMYMQKKSILYFITLHNTYLRNFMSFVFISQKYFWFFLRVITLKDTITNEDMYCTGLQITVRCLIYILHIHYTGPFYLFFQNPDNFSFKIKIVLFSETNNLRRVLFGHPVK